MTNAFAPFAEVLDDRHGWIENYKKESGRKIAGYFCDYMPEEVLWAAGFVPIRITGGRGNVTAADQHLQVNVCSFARRCFDQMLEGVYDYLDAMAVPHTCDVITKMYDLVAYRLDKPDFIHYVWVPHKVFDEGAFPVMEGEVRRLKKCAEEHTGKKITDEELLDAIAVYDKSRALLKKVYELRQSSPPLISGEEAFSIALTSLLTPKDVHNQWVESFLAEREDNFGDTILNSEKNKPPLDTENNQELSMVSPKLRRPRILVSASMLDDLDLIRAIEDSGAWLVADDVCSGSRYFWDLVGDVDGDPIKAITKRYLNKVPCPRSVDSMTPRYEHLLNSARDYKVDGIIFYILRCCDAHLFQYPVLNERLQKEGYRVLYMQGDQTIGVNEALINRIKAFTETLAE